MNGDVALGVALGVALVGGCAGEWVRRRPAPIPPHVAHLEILFVLVATLLGGFLGGCVGHAVSGGAPARTAEVWTPCDPPRPGVACWRSGHAVVCLPEENP